MPFRRLAENRIRDAIAQGEFENLPGTGQPLNLEDYFTTPEDVRMAHALLKNANCVPAEVELLKDVTRLKNAVAAAPDVATKQQLRRELARREVELAIARERHL